MWKTSGCRFVAGESNVDVTTCECDHLTVFAALMDPYGLSVSPRDCTLCAPTNFHPYIHT